jgi:hypothetical protein
VSIAIDAVSEVRNYWGTTSVVHPLLARRGPGEDPLNLDNAYRLLNIQDRSVGVLEVLTTRKRLVADFEGRRAKASGPLAAVFDRWICDANRASETICNSKK